MICVDTSAWYAIFTPTDPESQAAYAWYQVNTEPLITSDYVIDELLTLLRSRNQRRRATEAGQALFSGKLARIEYVTQADVAAAWTLFQRYHDKPWSFTDCTSFAVVGRMQIAAAFALDDDFIQYGKVIVFP